jgi:hypothetical protein
MPLDQGAQELVPDNPWLGPIAATGMGLGLNLASNLPSTFGKISPLAHGIARGLTELGAAAGAITSHLLGQGQIWEGSLIGGMGLGLLPYAWRIGEAVVRDPWTVLRAGLGGSQTLDPKPPLVPQQPRSGLGQDIWGPVPAEGPLYYRGRGPRGALISGVDR